jgi:hypothetical protein
VAGRHLIPRLLVLHDTAIAFLYFEILHSLGDRANKEEEIGRMTSLNTMLVAAGYDEIIFGDFADCTVELLQQTAEAVVNGSGDHFLTEYFNSEENSSAIIMHFRVSNLSTTGSPIRALAFPVLWLWS